MFTFIIFVKSKSRTKSPADQGHTEIDSKKGYQILETNTSPCPIFALETWRGSLKITSVPANLDEDSYDMFINFISVENLSKWPAYLRHAEKIDA